MKHSYRSYLVRRLVVVLSFFSPSRQRRRCGARNKVKGVLPILPRVCACVCACARNERRLLVTVLPLRREQKFSIHRGRILRQCVCARVCWRRSYTTRAKNFVHAFTLKIRHFSVIMTRVGSGVASSIFFFHDKLKDFFGLCLGISHLVGCGGVFFYYGLGSLCRRGDGL